MVMRGLTYKTQTPLGDAFVTLNSDEAGDPFEMFLTIGKSGSDVAAMTDALGRIISLVLRLQSPVEPRERVRQIIAQLSGIGGMRSVGFGPNRVRSVPDAIAKVLAEEFEFKVNGKVVDAPKTPINADSVNGAAASVSVSTNGTAHESAIDAIKKANGAGTHGTMPASLADVYGQSPQIIEMPVAETTASIATIEQLPLEAETNSHADICPQCGATSFVHEEGCSKCYSCGHAEC